MRSLRLFVFATLCLATQAFGQSNVVSDQVEFDALKVLWDSTGGQSNWTTKTNWPTAGNWPSTATATQMDTWFGIVVANGDITEIQLSGNQLTGKLPAALANLSKLRVININGGKLNGAIPTWLGGMTQLTFLRLDNNLLTGSIPSQLNNLTALETLALSYNSLSGTIPDLSSLSSLKGLNLGNNPGFTVAPIPSWIVNLTNLEGLNLNNSRRNGTIPDLSSLTHLIDLALANNSLTGELPVSLTDCDLRTLDLSYNQISGALPWQISNMSSLVTLLLGNNKFSGSVPDQINDLHGLQNLYLYQNLLTGFPAHLSGLTSVIIIDINNNKIEGPLPEFANGIATLLEIRFYNNKFSGSIPASYGSIPNLTTLMLYDNQLSGDIPMQLGSLSKLIHLRLQNNQLEGSLPSQLGNLTNLNNLYLHNNRLEGEIPSSFSALTKLTYFYLYSNKFSGVLPSIFGGMTFLYGLNIQNNRFSGALPALRGSAISVNDNHFTGDFPGIAASSPIVSVNASGNQFTSIPSSVSTWTSLTSLNFSNNELTTLPSSLLTHSNRANLLLNVTQNRLDFSVMDPYATGGFKAPLSMMPQKNIKDVATHTLTLGSQLVLTARPGGATATWEKQDATSSWTTLNNDQDVALQTYTRTAAAEADKGTYRWKLTSTAFPNTTLVSDPMVVNTSMGFTLNNWAFQYRYDARKRMIQKKVPGAEWVYMVYDDRDRLVFTQDGEQRKTRQWTFTRYDALNRPIITGLYTHTAVVDQDSMSNLVSDAVFYESFDGSSSFFGYTNNVMSSSSFGGTFEPLTITYYDNYDFLHGDPYFSYQPAQLTGQYEHTSGAAFPFAVGAVTGTRIRILGTDRQWLRTVNYYDDRNRVVQTISDNHKRGQDVTTNKYDFTGKVLETKTTSTDHRIAWSSLQQYAKPTEERLQCTTGGQTAYGFSAQDIAGNGWVEFTCSADIGSATTRTFGLTTGTPSTVSYGVRQIRTIGPAASTIQVYEAGVAKGSPLANEAGDVVRIERKNGVIYYSKNGVVFYQTTVSTTPSLKAHAVMTTALADVYNPRISVNGTLRSTERHFEYDHAGRLVRTWHSVDGAAMVLLSEQKYNEIGQLVDKRLHSQDTANFHQSIDYRYNIRGWLTSVNGTALENNNYANVDDGHDRRDLFGMDLLYNLEVAGIGNSAMYNGNISSMLWSSNLGLGDTTQRAYRFDYDFMNRLTSASQKIKYDGTWASSGAFHESGLSYDLNGNIKTLNRTDGKGTGMDVLSYDYGTDDVTSNRLRNVSDDGTEAGFTDETSGEEDYVYDNNGNLVVDRNKSIQSITYNHLNLPVKVIKTSGDYIVYNYDATGKKLMQDVYNPANVLKKRSDYRGEWFLENDTLRFLNHEEGRSVVEGAWVPAPQLVPNAALATTTNYTGQNATLTSVAINDQTYMKVTSSQSGGTPGVIGAPIDVRSGGQYTVMIRGYRTGNAPVQLYVNGLGTVGSAIVWAGPGLASGAGAEGWMSYTFTVPTYHNRVAIRMGWASSVQSGEDFYLNDIQLYEYHPGHGNEVFSQSGYTYEYHLKDHLGNVRMTFTTKDEVETATATLEADSVEVDGSNFLRYDLAKRVKSFLFDHTNDDAADSIGYAQRLNGSANERIGLAKSLSVMPGDTIRAEVYAKYVDFDENNWEAALETLIGYLGAPGSAPPGTIVDGSGYTTSGVTSLGVTPVDHGTVSEGGVPKAYLNYIFINRNFDISSIKVLFQRITAAGKEDGSDGDHDYLALQAVIGEAGYVYVYLSNDGEEEREVYFDDFKVEHVKSPVVSSQDYYPFGLAHSSYQRENSIRNRYLYNQGAGEKKFNTERVADLDLNVDLSRYRTYDYATGRWWQVDPKADSQGQESWSTYQFGFNNPILHNDPEGDVIPIVVGLYYAAVAVAAVGVAYFGKKAIDSTTEVIRIETENSSRSNQLNSEERVKEKALEDLKPLHSPELTEKSESGKEIGKLTDEQLLDAANNPKDGERVKENTKTGKLQDGNTRVNELKKRAADPNNKSITPKTKIRVEDYTPDDSDLDLDFVGQN